MRRRRTTHGPLTDRQLVDLYESLRGHDDDEMHAVLAGYGTDFIEAIRARVRLRGAYSPNNQEGMNV